MRRRKITTSLGRGIDVLHSLCLPAFRHNTAPPDVLQIGAGAAVRAPAQLANENWLTRKIENSIRRLPPPMHFYRSYEPLELSSAIDGPGNGIRLRVADIKPYVLSVAHRQVEEKLMAFELIDISCMPDASISEKFDVCIALNGLPHIQSTAARQQHLADLVKLTRAVGTWLVPAVQTLARRNYTARVK